MKFVADLHLHSHYSRATSKNLNFEHLAKWAQLKGVHVVGTGDISHPGWLQEMKDKLEPAEEGLFRLKDEAARPIQSDLPPACQAPVRFMLAGEISSIYKKNDKVRKIHNVIFAPSLEAVAKIQAALERIGNIRSDGRPILGLDSRDLLEIILDIDDQNYLIPAHIWTPWFSLLGSKSGFDSVEECFDDLTAHIFALETGLSSDPPMNWRVSALDRYTLVSNSDAHSPQKLAREANLFDTDLSYPAIFAALKSGEPDVFLGTVEFFPEEGKYHHDGHRKCNINWEPKVTIAHNNLCSACGKPVTVGVLHRVEVLADRAEGERPERTHPFYSLIPLPEILAEVHRVGPNAKRVQQDYELLLNKVGPELSILQDIPLEEIGQVGGSLLAEGIRRMRRGEVSIAAGYDGEFGVIKLFEEEERDRLAGQLSFMPAPEKQKKAEPDERHPPSAIAQAAANYQAGQQSLQWTQATLFEAPQPLAEKVEHSLLTGLNPEQNKAALCTDVPLIIVAGPGTGKTRTLTYRIAYLIAQRDVSPENILAITFTNKAAAEMASRLTELLGTVVAAQILIKTFHAFGAMILRENGPQFGLNPAFTICSDDQRQALLKQGYPEMKSSDLNTWLEQISAAKNQLQGPDAPELSAEFAKIYDSYEAILKQKQVLDFDDLIVRTVRLFESQPAILRKYQTRFRWISVDEYQDINHAQYRLLRLLTGPETNLCGIGDPDQAIYGFRGASREYFLKFQEDYPGARTIHLSQNYRSTQLILDAAGQVIAKNPAEARVEVWSEFLNRTRLDVYQAPTEKAEAEYVVHQIENMVGGTSYFSIDSGRVEEDEPTGRTFADFAVLYRLGALSQPLLEAFQRSGIPYQSVGQTPLTDFKDIRTILACLWLLYNPEATFPLEQLLSKNRWPKVMTGLRAMVPARPVSALIEQLRQFLIDQAGLPVDDRSDERIRQLMRRATPFENRLGQFLEAMVLQRETDHYDPRADRVTLMTLHAAKGLEFPVVFIVGCEDNLLPYRREGKAVDLAEERRLFYVGMTRAQQKLILTQARRRFLFGQHSESIPSPFLDDIEQALKEIKKSSYRKAAEETPDSLQLKLF